MSTINGAFVYPTHPDAVLGALSIDFQEEQTPTVQTADAETAWLTQNSELESYMGQLQVATFKGTLTGAGAAQFSHYLTGADHRVHSCGAWYNAGADGHGGTAAKPLVVTFVDSAYVALSGGGANAAYRCVLLLLSTNTGW